VGAASLLLAAVAIFLVAAVRDRGNGAITGDAQPVVSTPTALASPALLAAEKSVRLHPTSAIAYVNLGNAYLSANNSSAADKAFLRAMSLAPGRPEAKTMHALIMASTSTRPVRALALLRQVEIAHPGYSHAWLVDGLLSSRVRSTFPRAVDAYQHFLALEHRAAVTPQVRVLLAGLRRVERAGK
jgi:cytochrome c-type biogenesis protein CcmH/NrfG